VQTSALDGFTKHALGTALATARAAEARVRPLAVSSATEPCPLSGSVTVTIYDCDRNGMPNPGDVLTMAFNQCRTSESSLGDGSFAVVIAGVCATPTSAQPGRLRDFDQAV
jgi:hypothetical protein